MHLLPSKMVPFSIVKNCVFVWTGKNDSKTQRVDAEFFENGEKNLRFQTKTDTCGRGQSRLVVFHDFLYRSWNKKKSTKTAASFLMRS